MLEKKKSLKGKLKTIEVYGFGFGGMFAYNFYLYLLAYYMLVFMTDELQFPMAVAASIYSATTAIKIVTAVLSGVLIDATNLKWGKYRSWIIIGALLTSVFATLMFWKLSLPSAVAIVIFIIVYILQSLGYALMWTANRTLVGCMASTGEDVVNINSVSTAAGSLGGILYGIVGPALLAAFVGTGQKYGITMLIFGVIILIGAIVILKITKKYDVPTVPETKTAEADTKVEKTQKVGFLTMMKTFRGPMIPFFIAFSLLGAQQGFFSALLVYFTTYVLADPKTMSYAMTLYALAGLVGALIAGKICQKVNKKAAFYASTILLAILYFMVRVVGTTMIPFLIVYSLIAVVTAVPSILSPSFATDISEYQEMKYGAAARAFTQSMVSVTIRVGAFIAASVSSFGLVIAGYQAGMDMTTEAGQKVLNSIVNLMGVGPAIVAILAMVIFAFYHVNDKQLNDFRAKKKAAAESAQG